MLIVGLLIQLNGQNRMIISFYAKGGTVRPISFGHAFVGFAREDPSRQMTVLDGVWGQYPAHNANIYKSVVGPVPGGIQDDLITTSETGFSLEVNQTEYQNALAIKDKWEKKNYQLWESDCVTFVDEIAKSLSNKIIAPTRTFSQTPYEYIEELNLLNSISAPCRSHPDITDDYNKSSVSYHHYTHVYEVCDTVAYPCCTEQFVFEVMKSRAKFNAPYGGEETITECKKINLYGLGDIVTVLGKKPYSITNYTKTNHLLHKGKVVRYVVKVGNKINVYTVGIGENKNQLYSWFNSNQLSIELVWGRMVGDKLKKEVEDQLIAKKENGKCGDYNTSLFLFDLSGSMAAAGTSGNPKLTEAKAASKTTMQTMMQNAQNGVQPKVGVLGFSGGCQTDPTVLISNFETDLSLVERRIDRMRAGGSTPLAEAIEAAQCKLANHLDSSGQSKGKLIILSDGVATCKPIRPSGVYSAGNLGQQTQTISNTHCQGSTTSSSLKYYTIGFGIAPGSPAERDLQFLSQVSGGKYLNVKNQTQLTSAFRKFNRVFIPKPFPSLNNLSNQSNASFRSGVSSINNEVFIKALEGYEILAKNHPKDCNVIYNLALTQEALDLYPEAIANYEEYLNLCPAASDKAFVNNQLRFIKEEYQRFLLFQKEVVKSDLAYLKQHFEKIQNGESMSLATEFKGFLQEKGGYYSLLPKMMGNKNRGFISTSKEVARGLDNCASTIRRNPASWDRDATPVISMTYLNLERLVSML